MWSEDDFYNETSEFEGQIEEFKESLAKSVKKEFLEEMDRLRKENENLSGIKGHFERIKRDYERKKAECDRVMSEATQKAKHMRAKEVMEQFQIIAWRPSSALLYGPKCDKCNDNRKIKFTLPSGTKVLDDCVCSKLRATVKVPEKMILHEISDGSGCVKAWYKACGNEDDRYYTLDWAFSVCSDRIIRPGTDFGEIDAGKEALFSTEEECRAYCKYLNEKNNVPKNAIYKHNGNRP